MIIPARPVANQEADSIGLYIHMPWCARKCPYCDFNTFERRGDLPENDYVSALLRDLNFESAAIRSRTIQSIYIGGGTPSLFSAAQIGRLLDGIHRAATVSEHVEITLEANPGTVEAGRFAGFLEAGVNRMSIGVQSLRDDRLRQLGRVHNAADARNAVIAALAAGFDSINLDLMYGLPGDTVADGLFDLQSAIALETPHLSWYQLTLEPNTAWERQPPEGMPQDSVVARLEQRGRKLLSEAGFARYEVSAYAKLGHRCAHNLRYWRFGDYVGIGAGAHSKLRSINGSGHMRYSKLRNPLSYMRAAGTTRSVETLEELDAADAVVLEYLMNALRLVDGTSIRDFEAATGVDACVITAACSAARQRGLLCKDEDRLRATGAGFGQLNRILGLLG
jgi:putative oxygen-independent coproporphyrinogen III oxidase